MTGLTGTSDQSDRCVLVWDLPRVNCLTRVSLGWVCEGFFFLAECVLGVFWFQGLEKSLRLSGRFVVRLL
jgi:hypothetical protein